MDILSVWNETKHFTRSRLNRFIPQEAPKNTEKETAGKTPLYLN